jgi:ABC-type Fe3+/spermidine/putrescine transport system ATPase subunit
LNGIDLEVNEGEMLTLLGPSGCGKTTTLRCIAGLEKPEEGDIVIDGKPMLSEGFVEPSKRGIGMVFQNYAVWPHMKVYKNIVYGLKIQKIPKQSIKERAQQVLDLVGLDGLEERYPGQLSGGQQQRVALARALVGVYVTHDQAEAMVISDRIAVMDSGNVVQIGTAQEIYDKPANRFVADFIGTMNFMAGEVVQVLQDTEAVYVRTEFSEKMLCKTPNITVTTPGEEVYASIRPEDVEVFVEPPQGRENLFKGTTMIRVQAPHNLPREEGDEIYLFLNPEKCMILV